MEINELNKLLRKHLKGMKYDGIGWRVSYVGNILTATCKEHDVQFGEVIAAKEFIVQAVPESVHKTQVHFSTNETYGAVINWVNA